MRDDQPGWSSLGFAKTVVLPAFLIFLIPAVSLCFFLHAERTFDAEARESVLKRIHGDTKLTPEKRAQAAAFFTAARFSDLMTNSQFAQRFDWSTRLNFPTFRWMIRLSILSSWKTPIEYREITHCAVNDGVLLINYERDGKRKEKLKLRTFGKRQGEALSAINRYWGLYQSAAAYQVQKRREETPA
jgi:hypothetical protein